VVRAEEQGMVGPRPSLGGILTFWILSNDCALNCAYHEVSPIATH
jgi:hypothetical protein